MIILEQFGTMVVTGNYHHTDTYYNLRVSQANTKRATGAPINVNGTMTVDNGYVHMIRKHIQQRLLGHLT